MVDDNCDARSAVLDSKGAILLGTTEIATQQKQHDTKCDKCMEKDNDEESRALEGLDTGWAWVVLIASFWTFFMVGGTMYANGIMHVALMERYNESVSLTSWAGALHTGMFSLASKTTFFTFVQVQPFLSVHVYFNISDHSMLRLG